MTLKEIEQGVNSLPLADKLQVLQTLVFSLTDLWPAIEQTPGVVGGDACIVRTRIPVWALVQYQRLGWTDADIGEFSDAPPGRYCSSLGVCGCLSGGNRTRLA